MPAAQLIVLERDGHWAAALRLELARNVCCEIGPDSSPANNASIRVIEIRSWDECWQRLAQCPAAVVATELTDGNIDSILAALRRLERQFPQAALLIVTNRRLWPYRQFLREAGALHFVASPRRFGEVTQILARRRGKSLVASKATARTDEILAELPWSDTVE